MKDTVIRVGDRVRLATGAPGASWTGNPVGTAGPIRIHGLNAGWDEVRVDWDDDRVTMEIRNHLTKLADKAEVTA